MGNKKTRNGESQFNENVLKKKGIVIELMEENPAETCDFDRRKIKNKAI